MSIKKLFDTDTSRNYLSETNTKEAFKDVESSRNMEAIVEHQSTYVPHINFKKPENFVKYGSAYLYYRTAIEWIHDYYPYDGSDAEINEYRNKLLDIEKYIFNNLYPRTNGFITIAHPDDGGWGSLDGSITNGYGLPATLEYITFKGGPGTGSSQNSLLSGLSINDYNNRFTNSNIYDTDIYTSAGLPSTYGSGSRESNLKANFNTGVTVEFWMKSGSAPKESGYQAPLASLTEKQVVFDWWNNEDTDSEHYGRILVELTSSRDASGQPISPFVITVQSGAHGASSTTTAGGVPGRDLYLLGTSSLHNNFGDWNHYAVRMFNTGSGLHTELYVNGAFNDRNSRAPLYSLSSSFTGHTAFGEGTLKKYSSQDNLQGWWRLNENYASQNVHDSAGQAPMAVLTALSKTLAQADGKILKIYDVETNSVEFEINKNKSTSTATMIAYSICGADANQFAIEIAAAVNAANAAGTLNVTATATSEIVALRATTVSETAISNTAGTAISDSIITATQQWKTRTGTFDASGERPALSTTNYPSGYIQEATRSSIFDDDDDERVNVGPANLWNSIIGASAASNKQMSFSVWINKSGDGGGNNGRIFAFGSTGVELYTDGDEQLHFDVHFSGDNGEWETANNVIKLSTWHHVVVTYDANNASHDPKIYIDGIPVTLTEETTPTGALSSFYNPCYIGNNNGGSGGWQGLMADFAVWNSILSEDEVKAIYNSHFFHEHYTFDEFNDKNAMGRIGALQKTPTGLSITAGAGKLSGSLDEFRFWKVARTPREIGTNWFTHIRGGVNTDISNTTLGLYYKFNEGITTNADTDSIVLDYSGRVSNGIWTGYSTNSRATGSAIVLASGSAHTSEYRDPIVRANHPDVVSLKTDLLNSGSWYDRQNNSSILSLLPSWIAEEDEDSGGEEFESDLRYVTHIVGAYFDKLSLQIEALPTFKHDIHTSASYSPISFAKHLPQSLGLATPELFIESTIMERFLNRNLTSSFEGDLTETKNLIYMNLYNNLTNIFKSKGTERSIKNVLRCFNLDDSLIRLNAYANRTTYQLKNNLQQTLLHKKTINLNDSNNVDGVIYQKQYTGSAFAHAPTDVVAGDTIGFISGSHGAGYSALNAPKGGPGAGHYRALEDPYGFTNEASITFPTFYLGLDKFNRDEPKVSLFGLYTVATGSADIKSGAKTSWITSLGEDSGPDVANFQVFAVRDRPSSKNVKFMLSSSNEGLDGDVPFPTLTSSTFLDVYNNTNWNFSVRLTPSLTGSNKAAYIVSGSTEAFKSGFNTYDLIFRGYNNEIGTTQNSFFLTASINHETATAFLNAAKRVYAGARRENITGSVLNYSDIHINSVKYWTKYIEDGVLEQHANDFYNAGVSGSYMRTSPRDLNSFGHDNLNLNSLVLNWDFENVTGSDSNGNFFITDMSSGSAELRDNLGWAGNWAGYQHTGYGHGFKTSSVNVIEKLSVNNYKFVDPERVVSSDMIQILSEDDMVYNFEQTIPDYYFTIEKSMYNAISEEMLKFFAGVVDFNNIIGEPVNKYRHRYKSLEKLREAFFRRVGEVKNIEKFVDYYKWLDDSIMTIISQLLPASVNFENDLLNVVESHVLERNKYQTKFPTVEFKEPDIGTAMRGAHENLYSWKDGHSTIPESPRTTKENRLYWDSRAERSATEISSSRSTNSPAVNADIDAQRENFKKIIWSSPTLSQSVALHYTVGGTPYPAISFASSSFVKTYNLQMPSPVATGSTIHAGTNFTDKKNIDFTYNALRPAGPVDNDGSTFIPRNVVLGFAKDIEPLHETHQWETDKYPRILTKRYLKTLHGRNFDYDGFGYTNVRSSFVFPFNIVSSSVVSGYNKAIVDRVTGGIEIVNLHHDTYGDSFEVPMQGPFTDYAVGGHQSRHVAVNTGSDQWYNRPEAWKLLVGTIHGNPFLPDITGAIGMVAPDYPWPEANEEKWDDPAVLPYPMTASNKAWLYRDFVAKRPVNFKNIRITTGSSTLGNYTRNYEIVNVVGAYENPRAFIENQPTPPTQAFQHAATASTNVRTILDIRRESGSHFKFFDEYDTGYLSATENKSVIVSRFAAPGGIETMTKGYLDLRSSEYSVYNCLLNRNLTLIKPSQGPTGTISEVYGGAIVTSETYPSGASAMRVYDIHGKDFGLRSHLARHSARFGRDSMFVTAAGDLPGAGYDQSPSFHKINRNRLIRPEMSNDGDIYSPKSMTTATGSKYDNFYVQHPIPRSDLQYSWFTSSVIMDAQRFYGYMPVFGERAGLYYSGSSDTENSSGWVSYFDYVSASSVVPQLTQSLWQPTTKLNILTHEVLTSSTNTLGYPLTTPGTEYFNSDIVDYHQIEDFFTSSADYLNLLLTRRNGAFGWTWKRMRIQEHPILVHERLNNKVSRAEVQAGDTITKYDLPPVSVRGRPLHINFQSDSRVQTIIATHNNEKIYFNSTEFNDLFGYPDQDTVTAADQIISVIRDGPFVLNWIMYCENIFPSVKNDFISKTRQKTDYDNKFWRDSNTDRLAVGNLLSNSFGINSPAVSQSCWPLDAQIDFLTRSGPPNLGTGGDIQANIRSGSAGELQNNYFLIHSGVARSSPSVNGALKPSALYARKHCMSTPNSVVAPTGPDIPETGSVERGLEIFNSGIKTDVFGGEALWEAGDQAGIVTTALSLATSPLRVSETTPSFQASASAPWFDDYDDYNEDLLLLARGFSVVPEFRISQHVEDYVVYGLSSRNKTNTFEIPGTSINSSTGSFYVDYSNSEFLTDFLHIKNTSLLDATEIRLVCSAAIRFNPYKGFYPAQRTLDLVSQFSRSYGSGLDASVKASSTFRYSGHDLIQNQGGLLRPLMQSLCSPGILYNSIKSGLAVDYPIITDKGKLSASYYGSSDGDATSNWAITARIPPSSTNYGYHGGEFWDQRIPFEAILAPDKSLAGVQIIDVEPNPSCSLNATASMGGASDELYSMMASNFFGEVGSFFLKNNTFTSLESNVITDDLRFTSGSIYGARIKLRRSVSGSRDYRGESGSAGSNSGYGLAGANARIGSNFLESTYPVPQDPRQSPIFKETFTMYSRPSAFGPPVAGQPDGTGSINPAVIKTNPMDSFYGYNWSFTPPYTNGEAWCDLIFTPDPNKAYDLEQILSEVSAAYWRADPGVSTGSADYLGSNPVLVSSFGTASFSNAVNYIYSGHNVNANAMQLSASVNLFGITRVLQQESDSRGQKLKSTNITAGKKWVIQPKWETPMLNFNDEGVNPITNAAGNLTLPSFASGSVPRGMWHQFGTMPTSPDMGIFLEIGDIPANWLKFHYDVIANDSIYNKLDADTGGSIYAKMKSLSDVVGFSKTSSSTRLGELAPSKTIKEAVVAVPYIVENSTALQKTASRKTSTKKKFIDIPEIRIDAAMSPAGTALGDSLEAAGTSIRNLVQKMERYVLPPQFDFLNNEDVSPIVMYIFEFEYTLDKDDLSYIWQNLAPRDSRKISFQYQSVAHELMDWELLSESNIVDNENLRWMVFKVKEKSQGHYYDHVPSQVGQSSTDIFSFDDASTGYKVGFNWPYDYLSFVELIKLDAEVLFEPAPFDASTAEREAIIKEPPPDLIKEPPPDLAIKEPPPDFRSRTGRNGTSIKEPPPDFRGNTTMGTIRTSGINNKGGGNKGGSGY